MGDLPEATREIFSLEQEIIDLQSKLDQLRQRMVYGAPVTDCELTAWNGSPTGLSTLFGDKDQLIPIHNMGSGWKFRMLSAKGTSLFSDMGFELDHKSPWPGMSTLYKDEPEQARRHSLASFGPGDKFCPTFSFTDLLSYSGDLGL